MIVRTTIADILAEDNVHEAIGFLMTKHNSSGPDGVPLHSVLSYWNNNKDSLIYSLTNATFNPGIIMCHDIIQKNGKQRRIANINTIDRLILRCIVQKLQQEMDSSLSKHCFAFRPGLGTSSAAKAAKHFITSGKERGAEIDIQNFFDSINLVKMDSILDEIIIDDALQVLLKI